MVRKIIWFAFVLLFMCTGVFASEQGFTQKDREILIRLEATLKVFMEQTDKRFAELRDDMNKRFEQVDKRFEQIDKRFEQIDKRFEQVDKRFEQMMEFLWMLVGIFTTLTATTIGFAYWDRRTIIKKARDEAIEVIEKEGKLINLIRALKHLAFEDKKLAEVLRSFGIL